MPADPYPVPPRLKRTGVASELSLQPTVQEVLKGVEKWAAAEQWTVLEHIQLHKQLRDGVYSNGTECVTNHSTAGCAGDTDDAGYFDSPPLSAITEDTMDIVVGANSQRTGKSVYSSLAVYTLPIGGGQASTLGGAAISSMHYADSATKFAPKAEGIERLFAVKVTYGACNHGEVWCLNVTQTTRPHVLVYVTRAYLDMSTRTGPDPQQLLPAIVVRLRRTASTGTFTV